MSEKEREAKGERSSSRVSEVSEDATAVWPLAACSDADVPRSEDANSLPTSKHCTWQQLPGTPTCGQDTCKDPALPIPDRLERFLPFSQDVHTSGPAAWTCPSTVIPTPVSQQNTRVVVAVYLEKMQGVQSATQAHGPALSGPQGDGGVPPPISATGDA